MKYKLEVKTMVLHKFKLRAQRKLLLCSNLLMQSKSVSLLVYIWDISKDTAADAYYLG